MGQQQGTCGTAKSSLDWFVMEERAAKQSLNGLSARIGTTPGELRESVELPIGAILASNRRYPTVDDQFWIAVLATLRDSHITLLPSTFVICWVKQCTATVYPALCRHAQMLAKRLLTCPPGFHQPGLEPSSFVAHERGVSNGLRSGARRA
jgi:hypothetical protein